MIKVVRISIEILKYKFNVEIPCIYTTYPNIKFE